MEMRSIAIDPDPQAVMILCFPKIGRVDRDRPQERFSVLNIHILISTKLTECDRDRHTLLDISILSSDKLLRL